MQLNTVVYFYFKPLNEILNRLGLLILNWGKGQHVGRKRKCRLTHFFYISIIIDFHCCTVLTCKRTMSFFMSRILLCPSFLFYLFFWLLTTEKIFPEPPWLTSFLLNSFSLYVSPFPQIWSYPYGHGQSEGTDLEERFKEGEQMSWGWGETKKYIFLWLLYTAAQWGGK